MREDASPKMVASTLDALYTDDLLLQYPSLISSEEAAGMPLRRLHPVSRRHYDPFDRIGWTAAVMESLAAGKELLFALGAALFLVLNRRHRIKRRQNEQAVHEAKERLDVFLEQTLEIERAQIGETNLQRLNDLLDRTTEIKHAALEELTHEKLRGDRVFAIFLLQCGNVISKIQLRIVAASIQQSNWDAEPAPAKNLDATDD